MARRFRQDRVCVNRVVEVDPALLDRFVPQIYDPQCYQDFMALYDWKSVIYTIYANRLSFDEIVDFAITHPNIHAVTVPYESEDGRVTAEGIARLHEAGKKVYMYTVDTYEDMALAFTAGADGLYTNLLRHADILLYSQIVAASNASDALS